MIKTLFLDIDDTLIHKENSSYCIQIDKENYFIHKNTQNFLDDIKRIIPIILISGRRKSSYFRVKEFIPHNIAILEHGGLIYNDDLVFSEWKKILNSTCYHKKAYLWSFANKLKEKGFYIDKGGRETSFRVQLTKSKKILSKDIQKKISKLLPGYLKIIKNKKMIDIIPANSGKLNTALFYLQKKKIDIKNVAFIGNDENDIELLSAVGEAITFQDVSREVVLSVRAKGKHGIIVSKGHNGIIDALNKIKKELIN